MAEKMVLIDGHSILNRAFFGIPDLTNAEGLHTNAVYGFLNIMFKILDEEQPDYLTVAFDRSEPTFRHLMFEAYKGTRKPMAEELRQQVPVMKEVLHAMGIVTVEQPGLEADDLLGTIAGRAEAAGMEVSVISGDRDLLQLATEKVKIRIPKTKRTGTEIEDYNAADVKERYQVTPKEFIDVKALMGDSSDNIPGVPGIGEKGATNIIVQFHSIENAYAHVDEVTPKRAQTALREHYDMAEMSKELATINVKADFDYDMNEARVEDFYTQEAYAWFKRLEFKNMLVRFDQSKLKGNPAEDSFRQAGSIEEMRAFLESAGKDQVLSLALAREGAGIFGMAAALQSVAKPAKKQPEPEETYEQLSLFDLGASGKQEDGSADKEKTTEQEADSGNTENGQAEPKLTVLYRPLSEADLSELGSMLAKAAENAGCICAMDCKLLLKYLPLSEEQEIFDVSVADYLLQPLKKEYLYEDIARDYLGETLPGKTDLFGKLKMVKAVKEKPEAVMKYACYQAYVCLKAKDAVCQALKDAEMDRLYYEMELPLVRVLHDMEQIGVRADGEALTSYGQQLTGRITELETQIYEAAGEEFNINSPKQLGVILFEKMQLPNGKKTKTGYSTSAEVLEKLAPEHGIVSDILEYRQLTKLKSTYADGLVPCIAEDGRIHTTFNQTITATGRLSSTEPNLQNIPIRMELGRMIRKVFIPKEGCVFVDADYSQIELRVLAHMSGDQNLINAYRHAEDIHRITASQVFHVPPEEVTPLQRRNAKAVNFGIVYGISSFGLSQDLSITRKEAEAYINSYFETFPGIKTYLDQMVSDAKEKGYAVTLYGRRRPVPELKSGNFMQRQFGERIAMNSPIQGTAADIIKIAMIRVYQRLQREGLKARLILQVHDELLVETPEEELDQVKQILAEEMQGAAQLSVDLEVGMEAGSNWFEAH